MKLAGGKGSPTFERRDSGDSSMWRSSELSISNSIPVILPARVGCMLWMRGNRRSPRKKLSGVTDLIWWPQLGFKGKGQQLPPCSTPKTIYSAFQSTLSVPPPQGIRRETMYIPNICFCSCGGAEANMEAVNGSWPCTWTAGCKINITPFQN